MKNRVEELAGLARRLQTARDLSDTLVFEVLELCSTESLDNIDQKYVLMDLCYHGNWDQALTWLSSRCLPEWSFELRFGGAGGSSVKLMSPHLPPFTVEKRASSTALAGLEAIVQAVIVLYKLDLRRRPK